MAWRPFEFLKARVARLFGWSEPQAPSRARPLVSTTQDDEPFGGDAPQVVVPRRHPPSIARLPDQALQEVTQAPAADGDHTSTNSQAAPEADEALPGNVLDPVSGEDIRHAPLPPAPNLHPPKAPLANDAALALLERMLSKSLPTRPQRAVIATRYAPLISSIEEQLGRLLESRCAEAFRAAGGAQLPRLRAGRVVRDVGMRVAIDFANALERSGLLSRFVPGPRERQVITKATDRGWLTS